MAVAVVTVTMILVMEVVSVEGIVIAQQMLMRRRRRCSRQMDGGSDDDNIQTIGS